MWNSRPCGWFVIYCLIGGLACQSTETGPGWVAQRVQEVVYGEDNRMDYYAYREVHASRAEAMLSSVAAIIAKRDIDASDPLNIQLPQYTLGDWGVCANERFVNQIIPANCSSTLIDTDLVITAGHCINSNNCSNWSFVFDFAMVDEARLHPISADDVYDCEEVLVHQLTNSEPRLDYAIVRLDRPVVDRIPAPMPGLARILDVGTALFIAGFGSGLPMKIDDGGPDGSLVQDGRTAVADFFLADLDSFGGNSGSGVFLEETGELVGILVRGVSDYVDQGGCYRPNVCTMETCEGESSSYAFRALDELCLENCGDGVCETQGTEGLCQGETTANCCVDCGSICGDGICNCSESPMNCEDDCGACGNGVCDPGTENSDSCCTDCGCSSDQVCVESLCILDPDLGDTCEQPIQIPAIDEQMLVGETETATNDTFGSCGGNSAFDRVFSFQLEANTTVTAIATGFDTILYVRAGDCEDGQELDCNDDSSPPGGLGSKIVLEELAPGTYYLFLDAYSAISGTYTLKVRFESCDDSDGDGVCDEEDGCPLDPDKTEPLQCGCGVPDTDTDQDSVADCLDRCPGEPDRDSDADSVADCIDQCPGEPDDDADSDGVADCLDRCPGQPDVDTDQDGSVDCMDGCPEDPLKIEPGVCGCGQVDTDRDGDQVLDCLDGCPDDADKTLPGICGCGLVDADSDADGVADCVDQCPGQADLDDDQDGTVNCLDGCTADAGKVEPGICGCGHPDIDTDGDQTADCLDGCPEDSAKIELGQCGCGALETDTDADGTADCEDDCPAHANKVEPGICGCDTLDTDSDQDGVSDCIDACSQDAHKVEPGVCGCGVADVDSDSDGVADCQDGCSQDALKTEPGVCGCGVAEVDSDSDGILDCEDGCPNDAAKTEPGICNCGVADTDSDQDGSADCDDLCPTDAGKREAGQCGCGVPDVDSDLDGIADCNDLCFEDPAKTQPGKCGCGTPEGSCDDAGGCRTASPGASGWTVVIFGLLALYGRRRKD